MSLNTNSASRDQLMDLLQDPEKFKKRMSQLEQAETNASEVIARVGPASEVLQLREQAQEELDFQAELTQETREECAAKVESAKVSAISIIDHAEAEAGRVRREAEEKAEAIETTLREARAEMAEAKQQSKRVAESFKELSTAQDRLASQTTDLESQQNELLKEKSKLAVVREQIDQALG